MAVANTFVFGDVSSSTYGVVIDGPGDYSAPNRSVESISIPGRNGAFQLDKGYYENQVVEYKVLIQNTTQASFETSAAAFRNAIVSQLGYQRLTDTYHPDEYRMAMYCGGFNEAPEWHGKGVIFKIKFDCKPQRWLTSGETAVTVANNGTMTNPTLFESSPLLAVTGYGTIGFNGYEIEIENVELGEIQIASSINSGNAQITRTLDTSLLENGDSIYAEGVTKDCFEMRIVDTSAVKIKITSVSFSDNVGIGEKSATFGQSMVRVVLDEDSTDTFTQGTAGQKQSQITITVNYQAFLSGGGRQDRSATGNIQITTEYQPTNETITVSRTYTVTSNNASFLRKIMTVPAFYGYSTQSLLGDPTYIDCDFGEAYRIDGETITSLNQHIDLGSDLPKLASGTNTFTKSNTVTQLKVTPRWWKV